MGRGGRGSGHASFRRLADLTGLVSIAERNDLTTLVSAITEKMHDDISTIFDSPPASAALAQHERLHHHHHNKQHHHHRFSLAIFNCHAADKENDALAASASQSNLGGDGSKTYAKAHQIVEKEEAEAMTPQLGELKKEALLFFRKWQSARS
ncbi:hypothetical protein CDD83_219 [Cordyceps sp. RAO-2017]|nr:hypothetical protein CDD83_219 [Cordyceps sp. RAO-2017]